MKTVKVCSSLLNQHAWHWWPECGCFDLRFWSLWWWVSAEHFGAWDLAAESIGQTEQRPPVCVCEFSVSLTTLLMFQSISLSVLTSGKNDTCLAIAWKGVPISLLSLSAVAVIELNESPSCLFEWPFPIACLVVGIALETHSWQPWSLGIWGTHIYAKVTAKDEEAPFPKDSKVEGTHSNKAANANQRRSGV